MSSARTPFFWIVERTLTIGLGIKGTSHGKVGGPELLAFLPALQRGKAVPIPPIRLLPLVGARAQYALSSARRWRFSFGGQREGRVSLVRGESWESCWKVAALVWWRGYTADMIGQSEALAKILSSVRPLPSQTLPLASALDRFAARDLFAGLALPGFDNSAMDGYAVVASSCTVGARLRVTGEQPAGIDRKLSVQPGQAVRIFTGAPMPAGADAVIMQEEVRAEGSEIVANAHVGVGEFVRRRGGDIAQGQRMVTAGDRIEPQTIALLAAQGIASVEVDGGVRAAIISTGDELVPPGAKLEPGQVYEANSALLQALLLRCGVEAISIVHCADRAEEIEAAIRGQVHCDVMIITGGVSVGARDLVKPALAAAGATLDLWRVAVKPGKPFLFGRAEQCAIFGLPGNPVSAFVTFLLFVRPAILKMLGAKELGLPSATARLASDVRNPGDREHYIRGRRSGEVFEPVGPQESHALFGLSRSDALLRVSPGETIAAGSPVIVLTWK